MALAQDALVDALGQGVTTLTLGYFLGNLYKSKKPSYPTVPRVTADTVGLETVRALRARRGGLGRCCTHHVVQHHQLLCRSRRHRLCLWLCCRHLHIQPMAATPVASADGDGAAATDGDGAAGGR